jgi:RimJ/RimL family protein N-acetyltransferase
MREIDFVLEELNIHPHSWCKLTIADEGIVQQFLETCSDYAMLESGKPPMPGDGLKFLQDLPPGKNLNDKYSYALEIDNQIIGLLDLVRDYPANNIWWIGLFLLHPKFRGNGLGNQALQTVYRLLRNMHVSEIRLGVLAENFAAYRFWQREGFELLETKHGRQFGEKIHSIFVMQKYVASP